MSPQSGTSGGQESIGSSSVDMNERRFRLIRRHSNVSNIPLTNVSEIKEKGSKAISLLNLFAL